VEGEADTAPIGIAIEEVVSRPGVSYGVFSATGHCAITMRFALPFYERENKRRNIHS
jgi:hypothetical protein